MLRVPLDAPLSAGDVLRAVRDEPRPFALVGRWAGARAVVGWAPTRVLHDGFPPDAGELAAEDGFVGGGWFGVLGFGLGWQVERLPPAPPRPVPGPVAALGWYPSVLRLDDEGRWWFEALADDAEAHARLAAARALLAAPTARRSYTLGAMAPHGAGAAGHTAAVAECVERIAAGELFQANLCLRLSGRFGGSAADAFAAAAETLQPAWGAYFGMGERAVLSFSPELFLRRRGRDVVTAPIKGTAPRTEGADAQLLASAKDNAEHVMIVDLMRNDLGRVAAYGSVTAEERPTAEPHPGLWHLVTRVRARLREEVTDADLLRATFPPGSVTGAPKVQSLKVISELEGTAREAYTGAIGYLSPAAGLELNVAIRTLEVAGEHAWLGVGGGIVADSDPEAELAEALTKARPIVAALGAAIDERPNTRSAPASLRRLHRPDPAQGLLETLLAVDGRVVALDRHLRRLRASAAEVLGIAPPPALDARIAAAAGPGRRRIRVVLTRDETTVEHAPAPEAIPADVVLRPVTVTGGLGAHKWADRSPLGADRGLLVVDLDGAVLEAAAANVWAVEGDRLVTPPAGGRLLPGVTRELLLEGDPERFVVEPLDLDRLSEADGVVLTSSIALASPAGLGSVTDAARDAAADIRALLAPPRLVGAQR